MRDQTLVSARVPAAPWAFEELHSPLSEYEIVTMLHYGSPSRVQFEQHC